jgi:hypothetical protein
MVELEGQVARLKVIEKYEEENPILFNALYNKFKHDK